MGALAKFDIESLMLAVKAIIVAGFNAKLDEITADKAKDPLATVLSPGLKYLGGGTTAINGDGAALAVDVLSMNRAKAMAYDPYVYIILGQEKKVAGQGQHKTDLMIGITMIDPHDYNAEIRMYRYLRALDELFSPMQSAKVGIATLSATEILPYIPQDFKDSTKRRLSWGLGLTLTW